jgi:alpha-L-arabinofuranosidase
VCCPANALQAWQQNDNGWDQGQIFYTPDKVWGMPPFYAQQMASQNHLPLRVQCHITGAALDVTATRSEDSKTLVLQIVNVGDDSVTVQLDLQNFESRKAIVHIEQLAGPLAAVNLPNIPAQIQPQRSIRHCAAKIGWGTFDLQPHSFTILHFE